MSESIVDINGRIRSHIVAPVDRKRKALDLSSSLFSPNARKDTEDLSEHV
jgi:hypothetical protein